VSSAYGATMGARPARRLTGSSSTVHGHMNGVDYKFEYPFT
jgi:hypothetical protein